MTTAARLKSQAKASARQRSRSKRLHLDATYRERMREVWSEVPDRIKLSCGWKPPT